jgi:hypothetical protein
MLRGVALAGNTAQNGAALSIIDASPKLGWLTAVANEASVGGALEVSASSDLLLGWSLLSDNPGGVNNEGTLTLKMVVLHNDTVSGSGPVFDLGISLVDPGFTLTGADPLGWDLHPSHPGVILRGLGAYGRP